MLPVYLDISFNGIRTINNRIDDMLDWIFETSNLNDMDDIGFLFPKHLIVESPQYCTKKLQQFRAIVQDNFIREDIEPIFQYILFQLLHAEIDYLQDEGRLQAPNYEEYFDDNWNLIKEIPEEFYINNIEDYLEFMFKDYDFLSVSEGMGSELEEYFDLMPEDIRNKVKKELQQRENLPENIIIKILLSTINQIESQPTLYMSCSEPQLNDHIFAISRQFFLEKNIIIEREKLHGFASKTSGETDLYFYDKTTLENIAIGESKNIKLFLKMTKQLLGYMNRNTKFGFTISINKNQDISKARDKIINELNSFSTGKDFSLITLEKFDDFIISKHKMPENDENEIILIHLILNLNTTSRQNIAKEARE